MLYFRGSVFLARFESDIVLGSHFFAIVRICSCMNASVALRENLHLSTMISVLFETLCVKCSELK